MFFKPPVSCVIMRRDRLQTIPVLCLLILATAHPAPAATAQQVEEAIKRGKAWLYSQQKDGNWEAVPKPANDQHSDPNGLQWGGYSAIATYALLAAGESRNDPRMAKAIAFLKQADLKGTYAVGLRCQVWLLLPGDREIKPFIRRDAETLLAGMQTRGPHAGMYGYIAGAPDSHWDHSVSQYGVLGLWALEQAGYDVSSNVWHMIDQTWRNDQHADGGWAYSDAPDSPDRQKPTPSMTAAGVSTLFIAQDYLPGDPGACRANPTNDSTERGLLWMDAHVDAALNVHNLYTMYGVERIGVASGRKYFATRAWYEQGADGLVNAQSHDGNWGSISDTCFALLFLVRGRAPVMMNKLQFEVQGVGGEKFEGPWNERPRDVANFARWMSHNLERDLNWQIVNLKVSAEDLADAPILYIAGSEELRLPDEAVDRLRQYVEGGGLILGNADCAKKPFADSFLALGKRMFPVYPFRELESTHPIYTSEQFPARTWKERPLVLSLGNGIREMMMLAPDADIGRAWQLRREQGHEEAYQLGSDIFVYAIDKKNLRFKDENRAIVTNPKLVGGHPLRLARLQIGQNWDPEPGGWRRMAGLLHNDFGIDLTVEPLRPGAQPLIGYKIAHLTGTTPFELTATQRKALTDFVSSGGTLVIDAAGGSAAFSDAAEKELAQMFPDAAKQLAAPLPPFSALYTLPQAPIQQVTYRSFIRKSLGGDTKSPRLRGITIGNRVAVFFSKEDLTGGIVGEPVDGVRGYSPESATDIMRNIILYASGPDK